MRLLVLLVCALFACNGRHEAPEPPPPSAVEALPSETQLSFDIQQVTASVGQAYGEERWADVAAQSDRLDVLFQTRATVHRARARETATRGAMPRPAPSDTGLLMPPREVRAMQRAARLMMLADALCRRALDMDLIVRGSDAADAELLKGANRRRALAALGEVKRLMTTPGGLDAALADPSALSVSREFSEACATERGADAGR